MVQEDARAAVRFMRKMAKEAYVQTRSHNADAFKEKLITFAYVRGLQRKPYKPC